ncbi:hypothetical protein [Desulfosporosinus acididurans]|nr:hypothetical protein [Desulfosporosinus acididurans]
MTKKTPKNDKIKPNNREGVNRSAKNKTAKKVVTMGFMAPMSDEFIAYVSTIKR